MLLLLSLSALQAQSAVLTNIDPATCLHDPDRFVMAHVVLSMNIQKPIEYDPLFFNGLRYEIDFLQNTVVYDTTQMDDLYRKWSQEA